MMEWTTRHYRYMVRLLSKRTLLYTEMVVDNTLIHSHLRDGFLRFHPDEHPIAVQLGGSTPELLARAARMAEDAGYDEINLNCGCPSARVAGAGKFGALLMFTPELVRDCVAAMRAVVSIPVTVKCRLGADDMDSYEQFAHFLRVVAEGGCRHFIVHARKCILKGLSPKDNRTIPPLRYEWVQRAAMEFPHLRISLNGGVQDLGGALKLLSLRRGPPPYRLQESEAAVSASSSDELTAVSEVSQVVETDDGSDDCGSICDGAGAIAVGGDAPSALQSDESSNSNSAAPVPAKPLSTSKRKPAAPAGPYVWQVYPECHLPHPSTLPLHPSSYGADDAVLSSVMIGRAAYHNPWLLATVDSAVFGQPDPGLTRREVIAAYLDYADDVIHSLPPEERRMGHYKPFEMAKPLFGLFHGCPGGAKMRGTLTSNLAGGMGVRQAVMDALSHIPDAVLDEKPGAPAAVTGKAAAAAAGVGADSASASL